MQHDSHGRSELIRLASEGKSIKECVATVGLSLELLYKLLKVDPLFRRSWDQARVDAADTLADDLLTVFDNATTAADALIGRGKSENIKSVVSWRNPARYSPRMNVEVTHTVDLVGALRQAEMRTIPILEQAQLERSGAGVSETAMLPGCIPPVEEVAPALHQHNDIEDFKNSSKSAEPPELTPTGYYNRDGSIKPVGPSGKPTGRPIGSLGKPKDYTRLDGYETARLMDMARQQAEQDYQVVDKPRIGRPPNPPAPPPIEVPDTRTPVDIEAVHRVLGIEQETSDVVPTTQVDENEQDK